MPENTRDQNEINPLFTMLSEDNGERMNGGRGVRQDTQYRLSHTLSHKEINNS